MAFGTRLTVAAGRFYPDSKLELGNMLQGLFSGVAYVPEVANMRKTKLRALIVPHAGYIYSGEVAAKGFNFLVVKENQHYVVIGPSHYFPFDGFVSSSSKIWETPLGNVKQIPAEFPLDDNVHEPEHSIEVELPFLQYVYGKKAFSVTCLLIGMSIDSAATSDKLLKNYPTSTYIISSDLSHYLTEAEAKSKDKKTIEALLNLDAGYFYKEENHACGAKGIVVLIEMAKKQKWEGSLISYDTSATASGDNKQVVGYASIGFYETHNTLLGSPYV